MSERLAGATGSPPPRGLTRSSSARATAPSLRIRLVMLSVALTAGVVGFLFTVLGMSIHTQTRRLLAAGLTRQQTRLAEVQAAEERDLLRLSSLMTESPTLRAALETYQSEWESAGPTRTDLLATVQAEVDRLAAGLDHDLVVVAGTGGAVLAWRDAAALPAPRTAPPMSGSLPCRNAGELDADAAAAAAGAQIAPAGGSGVMSWGGSPYLSGCVPIVLGGDVIGSLLVGDRLDDRFVARIRDLMGADVVLTTGGQVLAATRPALASATGLSGATGRLAPRGGAGRDPALDDPGRVVRAGDEEFVTLSVPLPGGPGVPATTLHLMHSLTAAVGPADRDLKRAILTYGALALALAALAASMASRTILRPLDRFVTFLRGVAASGDHARRFAAAGGSSEMTLLASTYNDLMASLHEREQQLLERAREEIDRMERLKESEKLAALGRMLSGAAHEINNPLAGVIGNIDLLLADPALSDGTRRRLDTIAREGRRIVGLVRNLLKTVHRDDGRRDLVDLNQILRECCDLRRHDFQNAGIALEQQLTDDACAVLGSELEIQQVFLNILNNGLDALQEAGGTGRRMTVRSGVVAGPGTPGAPDSEVTVTFLDNGPGMKHPERVFDHFYTTKPIGKGTGLGLSITTAIVRSHEGTIAASNRPEGGACFTIRLPRAVARPMPRAAGPLSAAETPAARAGAAAPAAAPSLAVAVLVVDDEPSVLELQIAILETHGATIAGARSGREAIALLESRQFDLVISDLRMPGEITGSDLYRWAERNRPALARRFVFVTGDTLSTDAGDFLAATGRRCVQKPFSVEGYLDALRQTLADLPAAA